MAKQKPQVEHVEDLFEPSQEEVAALSLALSKITPRKVGGRTQPRIDLYAAEQGIIRFDEYGNTIVRQTRLWRELQDVNKRVQKQQYIDQERLFTAFPEKREEARAKIGAILKSLGEKLVSKPAGASNQ